MLGHQHHVPCPGRTDGPHPLFNVEFAGVEHTRIGFAVAPFAIEKSISPKMNDDAKLKVLPLHLLR